MNREPSDDGSDVKSEEPVRLPIDGLIDLHAFDPKDLGDLLPEYLRACRERGILDVRIVHGKGQGVLRRAVQALLARHPGVDSFRAADETGGGWGATLVRLRPFEEADSTSQEGESR